MDLTSEKASQNSKWKKSQSSEKKTKKKTSLIINDHFFRDAWVTYNQTLMVFIYIWEIGFETGVTVLMPMGFIWYWMIFVLICQEQTPTVLVLESFKLTYLLYILFRDLENPMGMLLSIFFKDIGTLKYTYCRRIV